MEPALLWKENIYSELLKLTAVLFPILQFYYFHSEWNMSQDLWGLQIYDLSVLSPPYTVIRINIMATENHFVLFLFWFLVQWRETS